LAKVLTGAFVLATACSTLRPKGLPGAVAPRTSLDCQAPPRSYFPAAGSQAPSLATLLAGPGWTISEAATQLGAIFAHGLRQKDPDAPFEAVVFIERTAAGVRFLGGVLGPDPTWVAPGEEPLNPDYAPTRFSLEVVATCRSGFVLVAERFRAGDISDCPAESEHCGEIRETVRRFVRVTPRTCEAKWWSADAECADTN
jgi:hypothetical protein